MKVQAMLTMMVLAEFCPVASAKPALRQTITVCTLHDGNVAALTPARMTASRLFGDIGIRLAWVTSGHCPEDGIDVSFRRDAPDTFHPGAMAYACLKTKQIEILLNRIESNRLGLQPNLLGYTLAHEITHVIQGIDRHSADGVMKAHWDGGDLARIEGNRLRFAQEDVDLILIGCHVSSRLPRTGR